ncbi:MAG: isoleucine--tRNA ligase [Acidobacteriota bacterium]|nr:isoleucine--tRNA ligase [Acidobacteriota bacterium]
MSEAPEKNSAAASTVDRQAAPKPLKSTLNLPQTDFPMKAGLPVNEPKRLQQWEDEDLYGQIRRARAGAPRYILHDGPPYANGAIHLGHALNKTLKDFVVKTRTMAGFDAPYVPGWDCHGLPIEIKVDEQLGRKKLEMDPVQVRRACREYAQKYLDLQRSQFIRMGIFGRWAEPYSTMDPVYEARIAETFFHFFENGFVYKGLKPVSWCIYDRTALAEAEVEYEMHTSPSVYVRYKLTSDPTPIHIDLVPKAVVPTLTSSATEEEKQKDIYAIIWTTTPWTLPASLAIAFHPEMEYVAIDCVGGTYIVAQALLSTVIAHCHLMSAKHPTEPASQSDMVAAFKGTHLDGATFAHPFLDRTVLGINATYVTADQGTGAVHTAPAHGVDDFASGTRYHLPEVQYVDDAGRQMGTERFGGGEPQPYEGLTVFKSNALIIELLKEKGALLSATTFEHSYPHCWRCHNPVITRATEQWFIDMETVMPSGPHSSSEGVTLSEAQNLGSSSYTAQTPTAITTFRQRALDEIKRVTWDPSWGQERITNMVATRPDWCISRQRIWGVPIAVFLCRKCATPLRDPAVNKLVVDLFMKESADAWYVHTPEEILPPGTACTCGHTEFRKEMDILDVWFESGASSHAVLDFDPDTQQLRGTDPRADLYAEGGDQHRGWFMSSLLCSIGMHDRAPFKSVATYGWTLDEKGRALSKSLGNFIDPVAIMDQLGGDIVRLWVASVDFREDVVASLPLLKRLAEEIYRKLRNTFRFLLGSLREIDPITGEAHDFDPRPMAEGGDAVPFEQQQPIDQYILARTAELTGKITKAYADFEFHRVYHLLNEFCNSELSAFYLDVLKDRLYTYPVKFKPGREYQRDLYLARRSAQTAIYKITDALARLTAPILSFTADEVWQSLPHTQGSIHLVLFPSAEDLAVSATSARLLENFIVLRRVRDLVLKKLEELRASKLIGKSLEATVTLTNFEGIPFIGQLLDAHSRYLPELFGVSEVRLSSHNDAIDPERRRHEFESGPVSDEAFLWAVRVEIAPIKITKCDRCWRHVPDVGENASYPSVCLRCAEALDAIAFQPYAAAAII